MVERPDPTLIGGAVSLKPAQEIVLADLDARGSTELTRAQYESVSGVSRSQAAYDIAELVSLGVLERIGSGRATRYRVTPGAVGRPRKWTDDRIRDELAELTETVGHWPRASEFRDTGRSDLYLAASRNGGMERWAAELGHDEPAAEPPAPPRRRRRREWIVYGGAFAALVGSVWVWAVGLSGGAAPPPPAATASPLEDARAEALTAKAILASLPSSPEKAVLRLAAQKSGAWVSVRRGSRRGAVLFEGALVRGSSVRTEARRIWVRISSSVPITARLNGKLVRLPSRPSTVLVTPAGVRVLDVEPPPAPPPPPPAATTTTETVAPAPATSSTPPPTTSESSPTRPSPDPPPSGGGPGPDPTP